MRRTTTMMTAQTQSSLMSLVSRDTSTSKRQYMVQNIIIIILFNLVNKNRSMQTGPSTFALRALQTRFEILYGSSCLLKQRVQLC